MVAVTAVLVAQVDNIPPVGAAAATEGAGADTAELIYSGAATADRDAASALEAPQTDGRAPGSVGEPSSAVHSSTAAATAGGAADAHESERKFLHRWGGSACRKGLSVAPQRGSPASSERTVGLWIVLRAQEESQSRSDLHECLWRHRQRTPKLELSHIT